MRKEGPEILPNLFDSDFFLYNQCPMARPLSMLEDIKSSARKLLKVQIGWRRHLHRNPELSFEEVETTRYLRQLVNQMGLTVPKFKMKTGLIAEIQGTKPGPVVAIRSDIDALPIQEQTGLPYKSRSDGRMHACGHDVHMATVLGAARLLQDYRHRLAGTVRFLFQPAEEQPPGGARPMIEHGALKGVTMIFGLHVEPHLATGKISVRDGVTMGSVYDFDLIIRGQSGHAARPHLAVDAIVVAAEVIQALQTTVAREIDPISPAVITFGEIRGGSARNVVSGEVTIRGTARTLSDKLYKKVPALIRRTVGGICRARGASFEMNHVSDYPVLENDLEVNRRYERLFNALFGDGRVTETPLVLGGEDFACYLEKVPGAMFRLGVMNKKLKADKPWHSPEFIADEEAMFYGTSLLAACALNALGGMDE
jgi:amidohydrolase